jgi:4-carboxymuconolactone decarboxylase
MEQNSIKLSEAAIRNHEQLFPGHVSALAQTDPEFITLFDNFAFDEVIAHDELPVQTRVMLIMAACIGATALTEYKVMVSCALNVGVEPVVIKEILYQAVPYVGVAKALDFLQAANAVLADRGIKLPLPGQATTSPKNRHAKGLATQKLIFGDAIDKMQQNTSDDMMHIQYHLSANCFGDYYTRTGLDLQQRELVTLAVLVAMGGTDPQVKGHIRGNINMGNSRQMLIDMFTQLLPYIGYPRTLNAFVCLNEVEPPENA